MHELLGRRDGRRHIERRGPGRRRWPPTTSTRCRGCSECRHGARPSTVTSVPSKSTSVTCAGASPASVGLDTGQVAALDQHPRRSELVDAPGHLDHGLDVVAVRRRHAGEERGLPQVGGDHQRVRAAGLAGRPRPPPRPAGPGPVEATMTGSTTSRGRPPGRGPPPDGLDARRPCRASPSWWPGRRGRRGPRRSGPRPSPWAGSAPGSRRWCSGR